MAAESKERSYFIGYGEIIETDVPVPDFTTTRNLTYHIDGTLCRRCALRFGNADGLTKHLETPSAHPNYCKHCRKDFATREGLAEHYAQSSKHFFCQRCSEHFTTAAGYDQHVQTAHHSCTVCDAAFEYRKELYKHSQKEHPYCDPCKKAFTSENHLDAHMKSHKHMVGTVECPVRSCMSKLFLTRGDLALHWEAGRCSELDRARLNELVAKLDKEHLFTTPRQFFSAPNTTNGTAHGVPSTAAEFQKCALCGKTFKIESAWKAHLQSAVHDEKIYRCPPQEEGCGTEFGTFSAVLQHAESQRCGVDLERMWAAFDSLKEQIIQGR